MDSQPLLAGKCGTIIVSSRYSGAGQCSNHDSVHFIHTEMDSSYCRNDSPQRWREVTYCCGDQKSRNIASKPHLERNASAGKRGSAQHFFCKAAKADSL